MRRGIQVRLMAFVVLSALSITYISASYLGFVDKVLGRGYTVQVLLPGSGGLYEGSEVAYRGVAVGTVKKMTVDGDGLRAELALDEGTRIPADSPVYVHNLSVVGEQYLSFEPASKQGVMLKDGDVVQGTDESLPLGEDVLLQNLDGLVSSLDGEDLNTVVDELGTMFRGNANPLRSMVDSIQVFIDAAIENEPETVTLLDSAKTVLQTQEDNSENIRSFARDLADLTGTLADSDKDLRTILDDGGPAADEVAKLMGTLRVELPKLLRPLVSLSRMLDVRRPALEQLLVTFPRLISIGPSATRPGEQKYGRVHLNLNQDPGPCTEGYLPPGQWRPTSAESFVPHTEGFPKGEQARCASGPPVNVRGMKYAPLPTDGSGQ